MEGSYRDKYAFIGEWYDSQATLVRRFNVFFYPTDDTVEMFDLKTKKTFVRRFKVDGIHLDNFYIGGVVRIFGRLIKIVDFASEDTRRKLQEEIEVTFALLKPMSTKIVGKILTYFHEHGLRVTKMKETRLNTEQISLIYKHAVTDTTFPFLLESLNGQLIYGLELVGKHAVSTSIKLLGHKDPQQAEPGTIRALYGLDAVRNCVDVSPDVTSAFEHINLFFPYHPAQSRLRLTATLSNCTLCVVKPHAVREGKLGAIIECIDEAGFAITALNMLVVEAVNASEFYEVYKGIVPEYKGMVEELASSACVAMEIVTQDKSLNSAVEFRKLVGPSDPEIARLLRPHTLRAKFGKTKVQNAIHCSDLPGDGLLEVEYFFKILDF